MGVCQTRVLLPFSIITVWNMLVIPEQMSFWLPFQYIVEKKEPLREGDRLISYRKSISSCRPHVWAVERVALYRKLQLHDLSSGVRRRTIKVVLEPDEHTEGTWLECTYFFWLGTNRLLQWFDRWLLTPIKQWMIDGIVQNIAYRLAIHLGKQQAQSLTPLEREVIAHSRMEREVFWYTFMYSKWRHRPW